MVASRSMYQLLLESLQNSRPDMAPDDSAESAGGYRQYGMPNNSYSDTQPRASQSSDRSPRDPNLPQPSRVPFAVQAQAANEPAASLKPSSDLWMTSTQKVGAIVPDGARSAPPWWALLQPPM